MIPDFPIVHGILLSKDPGRLSGNEGCPSKEPCPSGALARLTDGDRERNSASARHDRADEAEVTHLISARGMAFRIRLSRPHVLRLGRFPPRGKASRECFARLRRIPQGLHAVVVDIHSRRPYTPFALDRAIARPSARLGLRFGKLHVFRAAVDWRKIDMLSAKLLKLIILV